MRPCKLPDYFIKVIFHIVVDMRQGESNIFQISTSKAFLLLKIYLIWKIRPISVKRWKTVWIRACPIPGPNCPLGESPTTSLCQVECWHVWLWKYNFFIMNFLNFVRLHDSNDSNKTRMGFALSRDLFYFGFFVAAAEFRWGFGRCYIVFRDVLTLNNIDRNQRSLGRP